MASFSPVSDKAIAQVTTASAADAHSMIDAAHEAFKAWRMVPALRRGALVGPLIDKQAFEGMQKALAA
ncbi:aldehyde dehydrogenase family protein, partial [Aquibium carbonis]